MTLRARALIALGVLALLPADDAFQVRRIREAGANVLAKSNLAEFAFTAFETVGPILSPPTGFPALTVPMGFVRDGALPVGPQIYGDAWSEATLIRLAYVYEHVMCHCGEEGFVP
jgi:Asp-tRNA(Asn)/Glu-tRNA(Gln) amidotransferase A subunit family amidase